MSEIKDDSSTAGNLNERRDRRIKPFRSWPTANRPILLLTSLILLFVYIPLDEELNINGLKYVFIALIAAMVFTLSTSKLRTVFTIGLALLVVILSVFTNPESVDLDRYGAFYFGALALFIGYSTVVMLYEVTLSSTFNLNLIVSALSAYLMLALLWSITYTIVEVVAPGSFAVSEALPAGSASTPGEFFELATYFSLVTLTTVGYGDITPVSPVARSITSIEPIIGQILLTVLVAWLVGMYISESMEKRSKK